MEHVVFSAAVDGVGEEFRRVSSLDEAVRVVEHLRNDLGIEDAAVFELKPVPLAFRTYYRVELPSPASFTEPAPSVVPPEEPAMEPIPALAPPLSLTPSREALESMAELVGASESAELAQPADEFEAEPAVHQISELPAMMAPGLEPRDAESEHSLGYFSS